jgi:Protein of unknown function (DUF3761)
MKSFLFFLSTLLCCFFSDSLPSFYTNDATSEYGIQEKNTQQIKTDTAFEDVDKLKSSNHKFPEFIQISNNEDNGKDYQTIEYVSDNNPVTWDEDPDNYPLESPDTYENVDDEEVQSPTHYRNVPKGACAICGDGTYSFSKNRRGTCSRHGGVAEWLK